MALWVAFAVVHALLAWLGIVVVQAESFADVDLYRWWMHLGLEYGHWPVLDEPWVYPVGALIPLALPGLGTTWSTVGYAVGWCALVTALDAVAMVGLLGGWGRRDDTEPDDAERDDTEPDDTEPDNAGGEPGRVDDAGGEPGRVDAAGAWWWLAFIALLGPVAIGRLDAIAAALMVVALLAAWRRPAVASALVTFGAWVKVAPGVLVLPLVALARRPLREVVAPAAAVCLVIVGAVTAGGGLAHIASFLTTQSTRGLQAESVAATPWLLARLWRGDVTVEFDEALITWQIHGPGTTGTVRLLDVVLVLAVAAAGGALWLARLEGRAREALLPGALLVLTLLVVANKVGSPQFLAWIAAPIAVALARPGETERRWRRRVAAAALVAAGLTQYVFPWGYGYLLAADPVVTLVLVARNVALLVLLGLAVQGLARAVGSRPRPGLELPQPS